MTEKEMEVRNKIGQIIGLAFKEKDVFYQRENIDWTIGQILQLISANFIPKEKILEAVELDEEKLRAVITRNNIQTSDITDKELAQAIAKAQGIVKLKEVK